MPLKLICEEETSNCYRNTDFPHLKFIERTDKFSIDDIIFPDEIPLKGIVLNQMSNCWMKLLETNGVVQNTIIASDASSLLKLGVDEKFFGRMIAVQECVPIPLECIVRGYYVEESNSWAPYKENNCNMYGNVLPKGLKDSQQLPHPIYTPSTKGGINEHDLNIPFADTIDIIKEYLLNNFTLTDEEIECVYAIAFSVATSIRETAMKAYLFAHNYAMKKGIVIADAKMEFGTVIDPATKKRKLVIISEAFTPDTCRLWSSKSYQFGKPQRSLDKHIIQRYARRTLKWNSSLGNPPSLPKNILEETADVYWNMLETLFDKSSIDVTSELAWNLKYSQQDILI